MRVPVAVFSAQAAVKRAEETKNATQEGGDVRFSIRESFAAEIQEWYEEGMPGGEKFTLGSTGPVLRGLGAIESDIFASEVLHADKKRTIPLLRSIGFQMPTALLRDGSVGSITYSGTNVNIEGVPFDQVVATQEGGKVQKAGSLNSDKKRTLTLYSRVGLQLPESLERDGFFENKVTQPDAKVKPQFSVKEHRAFLKENAKLREVNAGLKEQFKTTTFAKVDKRALE